MVMISPVSDTFEVTNNVSLVVRLPPLKSTVNRVLPPKYPFTTPFPVIDTFEVTNNVLLADKLPPLRSVAKRV